MIKYKCTTCGYTSYSSAEPEHLTIMLCPYCGSEQPELHVFYVSLVRGLQGYYVKFLAPDEITVRQYAAKYFGRLWCSVYDPRDLRQIIERYGATVINSEQPIIVEEVDEND